jgi:cobalt/nickel transport system permease protein
MENNIPSYLLQNGNEQHSGPKRSRPRLSFLNKTILASATAIRSVYLQAENATKESPLHKINPHIKFLSLVFFEVVISIVHNPGVQILITAMILFLCLISGLQVSRVYGKIFFLAFIFGFLILIPASLNVISPGRIIFRLFEFNAPWHFWIYKIPKRIGFTSEGIRIVLLVFLRVFNSISFAMFIVFTTSFPALIKSFRTFGIPDTFLMIISLAYKYIFILSRTLEESFFALKSRLISNVNNNTLRKLVSGLVFSIFKRSVRIYENTYYAMLSRGYRGEVILDSQEDLAFKDFLFLFILVALGIGFILV